MRPITRTEGANASAVGAKLCKGGTGACSPGKFLKKWCNLVSFGSFYESKFLVQKALISTEKTQEFENDSSNGLVDKNMHTYE